LARKRDKNWHHPFPVARFKNRVKARVHDAYNLVFKGHLTAWEAEKFLREQLAGADGMISDEALSDERRLSSRSKRRRKRRRARETELKKQSPVGKSDVEGWFSYREAFELVFGTERQVERCVEILHQHPWMIPGATYRWEGNRVIIILDYDEMQRAALNRNDVDGLLPDLT
jgi:hypothetical protein